LELLGQSGTIGIFGIFAILVIREALLFAGKHPTQNGIDKAVHTVPAQCPIVTRMESKVEELHALHTMRDSDGVQVLPRLAQQSRLQTDLLVEIRDGIGTLVNGGASASPKKKAS
jgi:hypothetical protein